MFSLTGYCRCDQDTVIHRLDPWTKLVIFFSLVGSIMFLATPTVIFFQVVFLLITARLARVSLLYLLSRLRFLLWFFLMGNLFYFFFTPGQVLLTIPWLRLHLTQEGLTKGVMVMFQVCLMASAAFLVLQTTSLLKLLRSFQCLLYPLFKMGREVPDLSLMMMLSFQFVPFFLAEGKRIIEIQWRRGGCLKGGGIFGRLKQLVPMLVPLFLALQRKSQTLSLAIELRGYTGQVNEHYFYFPHFQLRDLAAFLITTLSLFGLVLAVKYRL